jgi:ribonucleoside-diphosphate reductase alpha chain
MSEDINRRAKLPDASPVMGSLRWPGRPVFPEGNECWTYMVEGAQAQYAIAVGHVRNGRPHPFEVWVLANEQPRCLGAVAKTLSADMRTQDRVWLLRKLDALENVTGGNVIDQMLSDGERLVASSNAGALSKVVRYRLRQLGVETPEEGEATPLVNAMLSVPRHEGTLAWAWHVRHPTSGDDFTVFLPEAETSDGQCRPIAVRLSGRYPRDLDALAALLSLDMLVNDAAWIGMKLRKLLDYPEPMESFFARMPDTQKTEQYPSVVAYLARLIVHRYAMLGLLTTAGYPMQELGVMVSVPSEDVLPNAA